MSFEPNTTAFAINEDEETKLILSVDGRDQTLGIHQHWKEGEHEDQLIILTLPDLVCLLSAIRALIDQETGQLTLDNVKGPTTHVH